LTEFGLSLKNDIVGVSCDGAAVMTCFVNLTKLEHQKCLNHGINLAIRDVMYSKESAQDTEDSESDHDENEDDEVDGNVDYMDEDFTVMENVSTYEDTFQLKENFRNILRRARKVVKIFKKSAKKMKFCEVLLKKILEKNTHYF
jgi:hypothetical protein